MSECGFCRIIVGDQPPHVLLDAGLCMVMLSRDSLGFGHCLVVPKMHYPTVYGLPADYHDALFGLARRVAPVLAVATNRRAVGYVAFGTGVPHAHLQLVPMNDASLIIAPRPRRLSGNDLASQARELRPAFNALEAAQGRR